MNRKETKAELKRLIEFYAGNPPANIVKEQLGISDDEANELLNRIAKPKRKYTKRAKPVDTKITDFLHNIPIGIIKSMASIVAIIALIRSGGYVYSYFARIDIPFFAILMASMIVLVSFISPQILVYSVRKKAWGLSFLAVSLLLVFAWFNIDVTIRGLAYAREQVDYYVSAGQENIVKAKRRLIELQNKEAIIIQDRQRDGIERDTLQAQFATLSNEVGSPLYITTRSRLLATTERYDRNRKYLEDIDKERTLLNKIEGIDSVRIKDDTVKAQEANMDKIIAVGLEMAGPLMLCFALFL